MNLYEIGLLAEQGYQLVFSDALKDSADLWLLNSCTVKNPSETTFVNAIKTAENMGKKIVVAGCVPQAQTGGDAWKSLSQIGVQQIDRVVEVVEETLKGSRVKLAAPKYDEEEGKRKQRAGGASLNLPKIRKNPFVEIVPINTGCLNQCTYCKTKHARGNLGSYPPKEITERIRTVIDEGIVEIWLTSEDTGAYGRDLGLKIGDLLREIRVVLDEAHEKGVEVMLRIGMTNPPYILDELESIAEFLNHPRVFKFLHIPIQSGSNRVLDDMRREYTREQFKHIVEFLREHVPGISIATDIICGFPTEQPEDHQDTLDLIDEVKPPIMHISQFYPRPGTPAARMMRVPTSIVKDRSREVTKLYSSYETYSDSLGVTLDVWVTDYDDENWVTHDSYYRQVLIPKSSYQGESLLGKCVSVEVTRTTKFCLIAKVADEVSIRPANPISVSADVMLHRTGRNNRSVESVSLKTGKQVDVLVSSKTKTSSRIIFAISLFVLMVAYLIIKFS